MPPETLPDLLESEAPEPELYTFLTKTLLDAESSEEHVREQVRTLLFGSSATALQWKASETSTQSDDDTILESPVVSDDTILEREKAESNTDTRWKIQELLAKNAEQESTAEKLREIIHDLLKIIASNNKEIAEETIESALSEQGYRNVEYINQGAMAMVFSGINSAGKRVAIKVPKLFTIPSPSEREKVLELIELERGFSEMFYGLDEEWFVKPLEEGSIVLWGESTPYLTFEYIHGPLRISDPRNPDQLSDEALSLEEIMQLLHQLPAAFALQFIIALFSIIETIQNYGFIHRDIKPSNIYCHPEIAPLLWKATQNTEKIQGNTSLLKELFESISNQSHPLLASDFGANIGMSSRVLPDPPLDPNTKQPIYVRTPAYANEAAVVENGPYAHSDRFSAAAIAYEMLTATLATKDLKTYRLQSSSDPEREEVLQIIREILHDPEEHNPHTDETKEATKTRSYRRRFESLLRKQQTVLQKSFFEKISRMFSLRKLLNVLNESA